MKSFLPKLRNVRVFLDQKITTYKFPYTGFSTIEPLLCKEPYHLLMNSRLACIFHAWILFNFDEEDQQLLSNVRHEDDVYRVMQRYVLDTLLIVFASCTDANSPHPSLRRSGSASQTDCYPLTMVAGIFSLWCTLTLLQNLSRRCPYSLFVQPDDGENKIPLVLIFIPPWEFGYEDFNKLVAPRKVCTQALLPLLLFDLAFFAV